MITVSRLLTLLILFCASTVAVAIEYQCEVKQKFDSARVYTTDEIKGGQYSVNVEENENGAFLSRCSYAPSTKKVTCDRYAVDKVVLDENVKIKKYYIFRSQFDVQIFPSLSFVENNGRGGIAYGKCRVISP